MEELLYYGISAISLTTTGSDRHEGLRACVSLTGKERFPRTFGPTQTLCRRPSHRIGFQTDPLLSLPPKKTKPKEIFGLPVFTI